MREEGWSAGMELLSKEGRVDAFLLGFVEEPNCEDFRNLTARKILIIHSVTATTLSNSFHGN